MVIKHKVNFDAYDIHGEFIAKYNHFRIYIEHWSNQMHKLDINFGKTYDCNGK